MIKKRIGEILKAKNLITCEQLDNALFEQKMTKEFLGKILLDKNQISESDLLNALSEQFNISTISLKNRYIDLALIKSFGSFLILDYNCFALKKDAWSVTFAITNPLDAWVLAKIEEEARGLRVKLVLVCQSDMLEVVQRYRKYLSVDITKSL